MKKLLTALLALLLITGITVSASDLIIESKTQTYNESDNKIKFDGNVKVTIDDMKVVGNRADINVTKDQKLDTATFYDKPYAYEVKKNKKKEVKANILKVSLLTKVITAEGDTQSIVFEGKTPVVVINANSQEYDTKTGIMKANGAVTMSYKDIETFSNNAEIMTDKSGDLKKLILIGSAKVKKENNESFADKFIYDAVTGNLTAYGNTTTTTLSDDGSKLTLKSSYQEFNQKQMVYNASGNVKVWFQDYYAEGPKVTIYTSEINGKKKPNEAYFTGRSSITQGVRTIYADKIKMVMKPKSFDAQGNTRTVIKNVGSAGGSDNMSLGL